MNPIRLTGLFDSAEGTNSQVVQSLIGYRLIRDGADWVIPADDPALLAGPRSVVLFPEKPFELKQNSFPIIADQVIANHLALDLEGYLTNPPTNLSVQGGYGLVSTLQELQYRYFFPQHTQLRKELIDTILPRMKEEFKAKFVLPVKLDVSYQQALLSLPKLALLVKLFGTNEAGKRAFERKALKSLLPTADHVLGYLDGYLFNAPNSFTIPLSRPGSALYFLSEGAWVFPRLISENIFEQLASDSEPAVDSTIEGFFSAPGPKGHSLRTYLMCALDSLNGLMRFLNDPRTFAKSDGEFDVQKNIQAQCCVRLMLADMLAINFSGAFHLKHRLAFLFLDKFANLLALMNDGAKSETEYFKRLLSLETGELIADILKTCTKVRNKPLAEMLGRSAQLQFKRIHEHVTLGGEESAPDETQRLNHLRVLRNLGHGTNLHGEQFRKMFVGGSPTIPSELVYVPILTMLAFGLDPSTFLKKI